MEKGKEWFVRTEDGREYGPADETTLVRWARDGRIGPTSSLSCDRLSWMPAFQMDALEMKWLIEVEPGKVFGPFNRQVAIWIFKNGSAPATSRVYRLHECSVEQDPPLPEKVVEKVVVKEVRVEVPVEKIVEKVVVKEVRVEVPVERVVEKIVEVMPPARNALMVRQPQHPVAKMLPAKTSKGLFANVGRDRLSALEAALRKELAAVGNRRFARFFGGK